MKREKPLTFVIPQILHLQRNLCNYPDSMNSIITTVRSGIRFIRFNTPEKKNALSSPEFKKLGDIFNEDATTNETVVTVITGNGDYFTSGNDMHRSIKMATEKNPDEIKQFTSNVSHFANSLINYPKIVIAVVNGPAIGIGSTILGLCDVAYASDRAFFYTPFIQVGLSAEFCSSYTFPKIMGRSKAHEMLLLGHKMSAQEALQFGLVSEVFPHSQLEQVLERVEEYGKLPLTPVKATKRLLNENFKQALTDCNRREVEQLNEGFASKEFENTVMAFIARKKK